MGDPALYIGSFDGVTGRKLAGAVVKTAGMPGNGTQLR